MKSNFQVCIEWISFAGQIEEWISLNQILGQYLGSTENDNWM